MIASAAACNVVRAALLAGEQACTQSLDPGQAELALQNSPADSDRSQPAVSSHAAGFRSSYSQSQVRLRVDRCMHATAFGG
jgi:hypothetical protein